MTTYIDKTSNPYFKVLAGVLKHELNAEISTNYNQYGLWILNFASFRDGVHKKIGRSPYIALHTEQMNSKGTHDYVSFLEGAQEVWSWSKEDLKIDSAKVKPFQFGYSDFYRLQMEEAKDIDILFYGGFNSKRFDIIGELSSKHKVVCCRGFYGPDVMRMVMRSKIVLSIHYYDMPQNDMPRIAPLLSVKACVVCEQTMDEEFNAIEALAICAAPDIASMCSLLLDKPALRLKLQDNGYEFIKSTYAPLQQLQQK